MSSHVSLHLPETVAFIVNTNPKVIFNKKNPITTHKLEGETFEECFNKYMNIYKNIKDKKIAPRSMVHIQQEIPKANPERAQKTRKTKNPTSTLFSSNFLKQTHYTNQRYKSRMFQGKATN